MDEQKVDMYMLTYGKYFEPHHLSNMREKLLQSDNSKWVMLQSIQLHDPTTILIISILLGGLGIDRFMIGDTGIGVAKLLTCGGLGIWALIDIFMIMGATREKNYQLLQKVVY